MSLKPIVLSYVETDDYTYSISKDIVFYHKSVEDAYVELYDLIENKLKEHAKKISTEVDWSDFDFDLIKDSITIKVNSEDVPVGAFVRVNSNGKKSKLEIDFHLTKLKEEMVEFD